MLTSAPALAAATSASAASGGLLVRYVSGSLGDSSYYHWTTTDPSQLPVGDGYGAETVTYGYSVYARPDAVALYSCTETFGPAAADTYQYLSVDPTGTCQEDGAVAVKAGADGFSAPSIRQVALEGYLYATPSVAAVAVTAVYRCIADSTPIYLTSRDCAESGLYKTDELLGYTADSPQADVPAPDLPESPWTVGLPLTALAGFATVTLRRRARRTVDR